MEARDIADLFVTAIDKIEFYWNFYTVTLLALIGWLVTTKQALDRGLKLLLSVGYLIFVAMNLTGLWGSYTLAEALRLDLLAATADHAQRIEHARNVLAGRFRFGNRDLSELTTGRVRDALGEVLEFPAEGLAQLGGETLDHVVGKQARLHCRNLRHGRRAETTPTISEHTGILRFRAKAVKPVGQKCCVSGPRGARRGAACRMPP